MVVNNFKKVMAGILYNGASTEVKHIDNTTYSYTANRFMPYQYDTLASDRNGYIAVGSGNTAPTANNYTLESEITGLNNVGNFVNNEVNGLTISATITNDTNSDVTIKEYGLYGYQSADNKWTMLTRTVLDSPITLEAGEIATITININF